MRGHSYASRALPVCCSASGWLRECPDDARVRIPGGKAMIKVSVMYPNRAGARFDHGYYREKHLPLIKSRMGAGLDYYTIDKGLSGGTADAPPAYIAACHLMCKSVGA